jgi:hypothetical protein
MRTSTEDTQMAASYRNKGFSAALVGGLAAFAMLASTGCALKESTDPDDDGKAGVVITVNDTAKVHLDFTDIAKTMFTDSGEFDLDAIRKKMEEKNLNPDSVEITGLQVTYDDSTKTFLAANKGVHFFIKIYVREDGGSRKLALETMQLDQGTLKVLTFDPDNTLFELNKEIFGVPEGFPGILAGIKDKTKHKLMCIAELTVKDTEKLKQAGKLNLNMVVTVAGK